MTGREIHSVSIAASAGYGKTEILCMRLLAVLLADPGNVSRTAAMTFTRAAAGEIMERTFMLAAQGLESDAAFAAFRDKLADLSGEPCFRDLAKEELSGLLTLLSRKISELSVSTIDSFMVSLAGAAALELGFVGAPQIVDEDQGRTISAGLIRELFAAPDREITELCRESLIGHERRSFFDSCTALLEELADWRVLLPEADAWGRVPGISLTPREGLAAALEQCDQAPPAAPEVYKTKLRPLLAHCVKIASPAENFSQEEKDALNRFFAVWDKFPEQKPKGFSRGWDFTHCAGALRPLLSRARDILLVQTGVRTRAAYELLTRRSELYRKRLWDRGLIQFGDLPKLLDELPNEDIGDLQYRMNLQFRHFLFDEFQDTSRQQWRVFAPIVQDNGEGGRSVTFVGDVKQAIYSWRGGDSRLMGEASAGLPRRELQYSFRSGQSICDALNVLFDHGLQACPAIPEAVRRRWQKEFPIHRPFRDKPGCFELLSLQTRPEGEEDAGFAADAAAIIAERLRELNIRERRLDCAILVRSNKDGAALKEILSSLPGFSAEDFVWEGDESIAADRVNRGLLALLYYLQHPADTASAELLRMDPVLRELLPESDAAFAETVARLNEQGLSGFLCCCLRRIARRTRSEPGSAAEALLVAARQFESAGGELDLAEFRDFAGDRRQSDADLSGKVRIMTVHHSKGLTVDAAFVPIFPNRHHEHFRSADPGGVLAGRDWLLYDAGIAAATSPVLRGAIEERGNIRKFEILCNLYVALTRARYEVCAILPEMSAAKGKYFHPETSSLKKFRERRRIAELDPDTYYPEDLLHDVFFFDDAAFPVDRPLPVKTGPGYRVLRRTFGDRAWAEKVAAAPVPRPAELFPLPAGKPPAPRPIRVAPSRTADSAGTFRFPSRTNDPNTGTGFGTEVHAFFEKIEDIRTFVPPLGTPPEILRHFAVCRNDPEIVDLLSAEDCEIWREQRFDIILNEDGVKKFVSGCFDRVRIRRGADGKIASADIIDFKSNDVDASGIPEAVEHYRPQMDAYARVLARLLELSPDAIAAYLVFTKTGTVCRV